MGRRDEVKADDDTVWLGVDLGTQSVRALAVTADGRVRGRGSAPLTGTRDGARHEQLPEDWWTATRTAVRSAVRDLLVPVAAVAVCSTSGTVLLTDGNGRPVSPALMYDDGRAAAQAHRAQEAGDELWRGLGQRIQPSWALAKLLWLADDGAAAAGVRPRVTHQADVVTSRLVGRPVATDSSHALKTGYDTRRRAWPAAVLERLGLAERLTFPEVVLPGTALGTVGAAGAEETGLAEGTPVVAGMTDGCAAQLGSGAWEVGRWNTVLGTTLVLKGVTADPLHDPAGVLYNHLSPDGTWLPGGASSVGAGALSAAFPGADLAALDRAAAAHEPAGALSYPLVSRGERFPFLAPDAEAFTLGTPADDADRHASLLQGVALAERLCLAYVRQLGASVEGPIVLTGGATRSAYWNQLRSDVLGRPATVPEQADSALGMAVLAARGTGLSPGDVRGMVRVAAEFTPRDAVRGRFDEAFGTLVDALEERGWLPRETARYARKEG